MVRFIKINIQSNLQKSKTKHIQTAEQHNHHHVNDIMHTNVIQHISEILQQQTNKQQ